MKSKFNLNRLIHNLLIAVFALITMSNLIAQEEKSTDLKDFKIVLEKTS